MKPARILVLAVALVAGLAAALLARTSKQPEAVVQPPPPAPTDAVLVAARELSPCEVIGDSSLRWDEGWPADKIPPGTIRKSAALGAIDEFKGAKIDAQFASGVPMKREYIITGSQCDRMASALSPGKRAVAITIDTQGSSEAGGFILRDDMVDVIHIYKEEHFIRMFQNQQYSQKVEGNPLVSEAILRNVRVLAIGQKDQVSNSDRFITGFANATLEVTPEQAETILVAQRTGTLTLTLRSRSDANMASEKNKYLAGDLKIGRGGGAAQDKVN